MHLQRGNRMRSSSRSGIEAWIPRYQEFGYSREEAEDLTRIAEQLWNRYTAGGLTIDSLSPGPSALEPFEVLIQAICHFGARAMFDDARPIGRRTMR
jgi:hypothetical protein